MAPPPRVVGSLQHEGDAALAQDEAVAGAVKRARGGRGLRVATRQRAEVAEGRQPDRRDGQVAGPRHADVHQSEPQPLAANLQSMVTAGTRGRECQRRPGELQVEAGPLDRRIRVLLGVVDPRASAEVIGLPEEHPLGTQSEHQADARSR